MKIVPTLDVAGKPLSAFTSGEAAYLLQGEPQTWGQSLGGSNTDEYPVLTSDATKKVYRITFKTQSDAEDADYAVVYANPSGIGGGRMPAAPASTTETEIFDKWTNNSGGGGVSVTPSRPSAGDKVVVRPKPDAGYRVEQVTVTDRNGKPVAVTEHPDGPDLTARAPLPTWRRMRGTPMPSPGPAERVLPAATVTDGWTPTEKRRARKRQPCSCGICKTRKHEENHRRSSV